MECSVTTHRIRAAYNQRCVILHNYIYNPHQKIAAANIAEINRLIQANGCRAKCSKVNRRTNEMAARDILIPTEQVSVLSGKHTFRRTGRRNSTTTYVCMIFILLTERKWQTRRQICASFHDSFSWNETKWRVLELHDDRGGRRGSDGWWGEGMDATRKVARRGYTRKG